jgi:hypothetical protein
VFNWLFCARSVMSDQIACEPVGPAPPMMNVATPAPLPPPPPPPVVVEKKGRGRPKKTEEEKARDKAKRLLEKNALKGAPKPKSAPTKPFAAKAAKPAVKRVKVSDEDEEGHVPAFAHQQHDDAAALLDDEADEDAADSPVSHQMCPDVDPDLAREKRRSVILRRPVLRIPVVASLAVTAPHGVDDDDDDGNDEDDSTPAWFTAIFNEDLAALKKAVSANSDWAEETHYVNYRPNQVWTAVGFAVERGICF